MYTEIIYALKEHGEYYAAGLLEEPSASPFCRYSRGIRRYLEHYRLPEYQGEPLYPCGSREQHTAVRFDYSYTVAVDWETLKKRVPSAAPLIEDVIPYVSTVPSVHTVGGNMYTHAYPNFRRLVAEGLDAYQARVERMKNEDLRCGLLEVLAGIRCLHTRMIETLEGNPAAEALLSALSTAPLQGAKTLYEALVAWNFFYYMDGCDNIGRLDADLIPYYRGEDVTEVLRCLFQNVDINSGWSGALGPDYNPLTLQCLHAVRGMRRPSLELRVTPDMPDEIWDAAIESVSMGGGNPSFYNEVSYQRALEHYFPQIPKEDRLRFAGGGCTETMLAGVSQVGSLDAGIHLLHIFEQVMRQFLPTAVDFEDFYARLLARTKEEILTVLEEVSASQKRRAALRPQPMRTLLIDDCIEKEREFFDGGARYCWSVVNLAGMVNVVDSLLVIRHLVFENREWSGKALLEALEQGETFLSRKDIPRHGTDNAEANAMAKRFCDDVCTVFSKRTPYLGGRFLPSSIQFVTYTDAGKCVKATPDGRSCGAPLCDSVGAIHQNDKKGATALLNSSAMLGGWQMAGTPVLNLRLEAGQLQKGLRALVQGYFAAGGMQMQVTCVRREELLEAKKHPERYGNLVVRVGGYSEYFSNLSPEMQQSVIERTIYEL